MIEAHCVSRVPVAQDGCARDSDNVGQNRYGNSGDTDQQARPGKAAKHETQEHTPTISAESEFNPLQASQTPIDIPAK